MLYFLPLVIPILSFLFQAYPRLINKYFGVDVWKRMIEIDLVRKNKHRIPMTIVHDGSLIEGYFDNPPIFPWLLSFIPKKTLQEIQGLIAPFFDSIQNFIVFFIVYQLTNHLLPSLFAQVIYTSIPLIVLENSYLTPRSLGYLNFTLAFYPLVLYSLNQQFIYLVISYIAASFIFLTHRFATQSLLFIIILFSLIDKTLIYLLVFSLALLTALISTKGYYLRVLEGHMFIIYFWTKNLKYRFAHQIKGLKEEKKKMDFVNFVYFLLSKFSPFTLIATNLWLFSPLLLFTTQFMGYSLLTTIDQNLVYRLSLWAIFFYIIASLVLSNKYLMPIGEGQRYLEMATVPSAVLSSLFFFEYYNSEFKNILLGIFSLFFIFNIIVIVYSQWKGVITDKNRTVTKDMDKIFKFINNYKENPRVLCIPHQLCGMILYNTRAKVLSDTQLKGALKIKDIYPILRTPIKQISKKYNLNLLVLKKTYTTYKELHLKGEDLLIESEDTQIFRIR